MNDELQTKIDKLIKAATNARNAKHAAQRDAAQTFLVRRALELGEIRDTLYRRLDAGFDYQRDHPEDPDHDVNETRLIAWLEEYVAIMDALDQAADLWLGTHPATDAVAA